MFQPAHRIRWKRDSTVDVVTEWCQDSGQCDWHEEQRAAGQEEDVTVDYEHDATRRTVTILYRDHRYYNDTTIGRMIGDVSVEDFEIVGTY